LVHQLSKVGFDDRLAFASTAGRLAPLPPLAYPLGSAPAALRQLAAARHVGKVVAGGASSDGAPSGGGGRWLISGGTGALGALAARQLAGAGARHLALLSRSGLLPPSTLSNISRTAEHSGDPAALLAAATAGGVWAAAVTLAKCDAAAAADAAALLEALFAGRSQQQSNHAQQQQQQRWQPACPPLAGVLHAGGTLRDGLLQRQNLAGLRAVLAPKAAGAARLASSATAAALQPLSAAKLFSSVAAALGSAGQANYAAANAALDAAAEKLQLAGLPGLAVEWGAWAGAGMAANAGAARLPLAGPFAGSCLRGPPAWLGWGLALTGCLCMSSVTAGILPALLPF
jgi:hypothetical protein